MAFVVLIAEEDDVKSTVFTDLAKAQDYCIEALVNRDKYCRNEDDPISQNEIESYRKFVCEPKENKSWNDPEFPEFTSDEPEAIFRVRLIQI